MMMLLQLVVVNMVMLLLMFQCIVMLLSLLLQLQMLHYDWMTMMMKTMGIAQTQRLNDEAEAEVKEDAAYAQSYSDA